MRHKKILSLFDYSGNWSKPYREAGYEVVQVDIKHGHDIMEIDEQWVKDRGPFHGVLAAPPCTDFAVSGARWWKEKDANGTTAHSVALVEQTLRIIEWAQPEWFAIENPVGRIARLVPALQDFTPYWFHPYHFGDAYTKKTGLWGTFTRPAYGPVVEPVMFTDKNGKRGSWYWFKLGGKSERTKALRSNTPEGFSRAFFRANP